ncbi:predicted protein [Histoplasma mississippiense (nom. inval.)]|uniref:predicted protein n=1 Tax=Ajellomyces capsulatus (strain NAm1 / WU24) TaxID=2059318 RepID=UPI000157C0B8|nr:predicted protein [Histoplasma mississippiense (nom. inval.)]EDN06432.1 predicted protein [Histoplasma mississippiense (nom. inval.)]
MLRDNHGTRYGSRSASKNHKLPSLDSVGDVKPLALNCERSGELAYVNGLELTHAKKSNVTVQFLSLVKGSVERCQVRLDPEQPAESPQRIIVKELLPLEIHHHFAHFTI